MAKMHTFNCQTCGNEHTKKIRPSQYDYPPKFCSSVCRFKGQEKPLSVFECLQCTKSFERYVSPGDISGTRKFCSRSCESTFGHVKHGRKPAIVVTKKCETCDEEFTFKQKQSRIERRFCSRTCSGTHISKLNHNTDEARMARWTEKFGLEIAQVKFAECKAKYSQNAMTKNVGRILSGETKSRIAESCTGKPNALKGMTYVEFYGEERAKELGDQHSQSLRNGFASGRLTPNPSTRYSGSYKGIKFRSLLELYFLLTLESDGIDIINDVVAEPVDLRVPWIDVEKKSRTYWPDFLVKSQKIVYEVKMKEQLKDDEVVRKANAAKLFLESRGLRYEMIDPKGARREYFDDVQGIVWDAH